MNANYRKHNDRTLNSSTYHKKDGTSVRAILKRDAEKEVAEETENLKRRLNDEKKFFVTWKQTKINTNKNGLPTSIEGVMTIKKE